MKENNKPFILCAWNFDGHGGGKDIKDSELSDVIKSKDLSWVHIDANNPEAREWLKREVNYLDDLILDALLDSETRPRMLEFNDGILMILRGVNLNYGADQEDMLSVRLWVDQHRIISLEFRNVSIVHDILRNLKMGRGPKDSGDFIAALSAQLLKLMDPVLITLNEDTDNIEEQIIENPNYDERDIIVTIRKKAIVFRRHMLPQREVIQNLSLVDLPWLNKMHKRQIQEGYNHVQRYIEDLDSIRERTQIIKDELTNALSNRMNKKLYVLSLVASIFLPLSFLTGLMGVNIGGIPGATNDKAFLIFTAGLLVLISFQFWLFKKLKWL